MVVAGLWAVTSAASAQVTQGAFKLSLDTSLLSYRQLYAELDGATETYHELGYGPGAFDQNSALPGLLGFSFGYVAHPHVIPQLAFTFGLSTTHETSKGSGGNVDSDGP